MDGLTAEIKNILGTRDHLWGFYKYSPSGAVLVYRLLGEGLKNTLQ